MNRKLMWGLLALGPAVSAFAEGGTVLDFSAATTSATAAIGPAAASGLLIFGGLLAVGVAMRAFRKVGGK